MNICDILSNDVFNVILEHLSHDDFINLYDAYAFMESFKNNKYIRSVTRCIDIARQHNTDTQLYVLLHISILQKEINCIDYIFRKTNDTHILKISPLVLYICVINNMGKYLPSDRGIDEAVEYYCKMIKPCITPSESLRIYQNSLSCGYYFLAEILYSKLNISHPFEEMIKIIDTVGSINYTDMKLLCLDGYFHENSFGDLSHAECVDTFIQICGFPLGKKLFAWIISKFCNKFRINMSVMRYIMYVRGIHEYRVDTVKKIQQMDTFLHKNSPENENMFTDRSGSENMFTDRSDSDNASCSYFSIDDIFHHMSFVDIRKLEENGIKIKSPVNLTEFLSSEKMINYSSIKYLADTYGIVLDYLKVPDMHTMSADSFNERLSYVLGNIDIYMIKRIFMYAHENRVRFVYLNSILSSMRDGKISYKILTIVHGQEIITLGGTIKCCPATGIKYFEEIDLRHI